MIEQGVMAAKAILMGMLMSNGPVDNFTVEETYCMAQNIYYEARGESLKEVQHFKEIKPGTELHARCQHSQITEGNGTCVATVCGSRPSEVTWR